MTADMELASPWINADLNSYMDRDKGSMDGSVKVGYQVQGGAKQRFKVNQSYRYARSGATAEINYSGCAVLPICENNRGFFSFFPLLLCIKFLFKFVSHSFSFCSILS